LRIAIQTLGTRGDVQPYIALALGLVGCGHAVQIAAPVQFEAMVRRHRLPFGPLPGAFLALLDTPEGKAAIAGGQGFGAGFRLLGQVRPLMRQLFDAEWDAVRGFEPDLILHHPKSIASPHMAEALACPSILASPLPGFSPTAAFPSPLFPVASLGPLNRLSHSLSLQGADWLFGRQIGNWRQDVLGLSARRRSRAAGVVYGYSRHVVPVPPDWGQDIMVSGYWFLDSPGWQPDDALAAFLDAGEPPIYVGFGSMPGLDPQAMATIVVEALARAGKRGLFATGGGALAGNGLPRTVHVIDAAPHDQLLPRVAAALHHGGAGTTGACLRAGRPAVICPFFGDQPFWGRRVAALGAGPPPLDRRRLTADGLAAAITATDSPQMRGRAAAIGAAIQAEDGVAAAVRFIEDRVAAPGKRTA
jgi:sterol 3beta-glucosyltransferase